MNDFAGVDTPRPGDPGHDIDRWDESLETRAQQIHNTRHRAGTAPVCSSCRAVAADDRLVEDLRAGATPPTQARIARILAAWRNAARR